MPTKFKAPVHIEIGIRPECPYQNAQLLPIVAEWIKNNIPIFENGSIDLDEEMTSVFTSITIVDLPSNKRISFWQAELCLHPYRLCSQGPEDDFLEGEEELPAVEQWELPNALLHNLWNSIVIDPAIKNRLISYCSSSIQFSEACIDTDIISWNRMILLHGPPGTGKTTICKGLAQKTFLRNSDRFSSGGMLLEVNSHSLFSKWFSESGKLVMKLFNHISEIAEDDKCMVIVLIDEVESITSARGSAARSNEPGDAVRVVNAVLTSLDALKRRPNVLVLCTSNLIDSVDPAFLDRVDMSIYLGPPNCHARYEILRSCCLELIKKGMIALDDNEEEANVFATHTTSTSTTNSSGRDSRKFTSGDAYATNNVGEGVVVDVNGGFGTNSVTEVERQLSAMLRQDDGDDVSYSNRSSNTTGTGNNDLLSQDSMPEVQMRTTYPSPSPTSVLDTAATTTAADATVVRQAPQPPQQFEPSPLPPQQQQQPILTASASELSRFIDSVVVPDMEHLLVDPTAIDSCYVRGAEAGAPVTSSSSSSSSSSKKNASMSGNYLRSATTNSSGAGRGSGRDDGIIVGATAIDQGLTAEQYLYVIAAQCEGMSGRSLRKLPIKAHSNYLQRPQVTIMQFLCALQATIRLEKHTHSHSESLLLSR